MSSQSESQIKILILTHNYIRFQGDHAGHFVHILARSLAQSGHKVIVLAPHQRGLKTFEMMDQVEVYRFRYAPAPVERLAYAGNMHDLVARSLLNKILFISFLGSFVIRALTLSLRKKIDSISAQWWIPAGTVGYAVSLLTGKPLMVTSHGTDIRILQKAGLPLKLAGLVFRRAKCITTVSSFLKERLNGSIELVPEKVRVIPMPVSPETFSPSPLKQTKTKLILCVARFTPQKKLDVVLRACSLLKERGIDFKAKIVGEGPLKDSLSEEIERLGLPEQVYLQHTVTQEELNLLYAESHVCVLPSVEEGFGLVLVEAQLCQRPVVGAASGGITDIIQDGESGLLVPPGDHVSLASAVERVLTDERLAVRLARRGYESAVAKFSPAAVLKKYLEVLT